MSAAIVELLGSKLETADGEQATESAIGSDVKAIGIYFSAHWCPPCRQFTPVLAGQYKESFKAKGLEVVFVSSDRDEESMKSYFGGMPWKAVPFAARDVKDKLSKKYEVGGIPSLVIVNAKTGALITKEGRSKVYDDKKNCPWVDETAVSEVAVEDADMSGESGKMIRKSKGSSIRRLFSFAPLKRVSKMLRRNKAA